MGVIQQGKVETHLRRPVGVHRGQHIQVEFCRHLRVTHFDCQFARQRRTGFFAA